MNTAERNVRPRLRLTQRGVTKLREFVLLVLVTVHFLLQLYHFYIQSLTDHRFTFIPLLLYQLRAVEYT